MEGHEVALIPKGKQLLFMAVICPYEGLGLKTSGLGLKVWAFLADGF